jgi:hypothetical protein
MSVSSEELNLLVYRYLAEGGETYKTLRGLRMGCFYGLSLVRSWLIFVDHLRCLVFSVLSAYLLTKVILLHRISSTAILK